MPKGRELGYAFLASTRSKIYLDNTHNFCQCFTTFREDHSKALEKKGRNSKLNNTELFDIYKWYPFHGTNCGRNAGLIKVIDQCSHGKFIRTKPLHQDYLLPKQFDGCTLVVGYFGIPPYVMNMKNNSIENRDYVDTKRGIEVNLLNLIAKILRVKILYIKSDNMGDVSSTGIATGNLKLLMDSKIDIAIGSYSITKSRSYFFDGSVSYMTDELVWCVPHITVNTNSIVDLHLDFETLIIVIILLAVLSVLFWWFSSISRSEKNVKTCGKTFVCVLAVATAVAINHKTKTTPVRLIFITTVILCFYIDSIFQTYLTSVLSNRSYKEKYGSVQDINNHNLTKYSVPNLKSYFQGTQYEEELKDCIECANHEKCVRYVAIRRNSAFCVPQAIVESVSKNLVSSKNEPLVYCLGKIITFQKNILLGKGSYILDSLDKLILEISSGGLIAKWKRDVKHLRRIMKIYDVDLGSEHNNILTLEHLMPVFKLLFALEVMSFLCL
ncbi:hypothetical protein JTB14_033386 [Gonioctena quinquepunctata]|nr:hypothetical protein JTB14_033386 [Gonioctena quinquepunctata]